MEQRVLFALSATRLRRRRSSRGVLAAGGRANAISTSALPARRIRMRRHNALPPCCCALVWLCRDPRWLLRAPGPLAPACDCGCVSTQRRQTQPMQRQGCPIVAAAQRSRMCRLLGARRPCTHCTAAPSAGLGVCEGPGRSSRLAKGSFELARRLCLRP
ncbi:hypothetical protein FA09DRAFT_138695 [Tilletiopsis washingtonensis]|uniref:Uncharacterized protein n=1 Tax=Tilletiopsis washingtonensis TaxID=58919 RepID=A0A316Z1F3_9BASI|nr:hypothetical protein FA09DRAFT_138695 [Tilletiopsis washingtonensis]PWN95399.1 hypothetical protein FA09DRAFT_138695 [Tilletiopsis washingtonensis]